ncbi:MAG TPA: glycoside hydrolase family 27 protein [Tepidisphaeraceae bacterium]|jgi:hypothetical protein|nr:glycoside hydrolase family 27 protein [Tepidisphaeraceae bacterium]
MSLRGIRRSAAARLVSLLVTAAITFSCIIFCIVDPHATAADQPASGKSVQSTEFLNWAPTPPMGWNSWDCFGAAVNEQQFRANADFMAEKLLTHGWQYVVVDIQWYEPNSRGWNYRPNAELAMDEYGRLQPAPNRFPSSADGKGFKPLADYVHSKGLKFGLHMMRGIPRQAVARNTSILGTNYHAADIHTKAVPCSWNGDMWTVDTTKPGAQEYYDSLYAQYAQWGVDFVKIDDLSRPYHKGEIEAIRNAIDKCGRPMVFSTSPGATPLSEGEHVSTHANMWRVSDDFWDQWRPLEEQFERLTLWSRYSGPGHYPDADMLPLGAIRVGQRDGGHTRFNRDEQYTLMTLWSICRSPLIFGGNLPDTDDFTLSLITNDEVLAVDQHSANGRQLFRREQLIAWAADVPNSNDKYLALFNARDPDPDSSKEGVPVTVQLQDLGFKGAVRVRDLWRHANLEKVQGSFAPVVSFHGAGLYRLQVP